jgi:hypothetical protein
MISDPDYYFNPLDEAYEAGKREGFELGIEAAAKACRAIPQWDGHDIGISAKCADAIRELKLPEVPHGD